MSGVEDAVARCISPDAFREGDVGGLRVNQRRQAMHLARRLHAEFHISARKAEEDDNGIEPTLSRVIVEAKKTLRLIQNCRECNASDERRWAETIEWLGRLA